MLNFIDVQIHVQNETYQEGGHSKNGTAAMRQIINDRRPDFLPVGGTGKVRLAYGDLTCGLESPDKSFGSQYCVSVRDKFRKILIINNTCLFISKVPSSQLIFQFLRHVF